MSQQEKPRRVYCEYCACHHTPESWQIIHNPKPMKVVSIEDAKELVDALDAACSMLEAEYGNKIARVNFDKQYKALATFRAKYKDLK